MTFLTQGQRNMLHQYGYYFSITFYKIVDNVVYYKILFGNSPDDNQYNIITRYSQLYELNIAQNQFPPKTWFNKTSAPFIQHRISLFKQWIDYVLADKQLRKQLFDKLVMIFNDSSKNLNTFYNTLT